MGCRVSRCNTPTLTALCLASVILVAMHPVHAADDPTPGSRPALAPSQAAVAAQTGSFAVVPVPAPGNYPGPQLITLSKPGETRLTVILDGKRIEAPDSPILLAVNPGEERTFTMETELRSLSPDAPPIRKDRFVWRIDRRAPSAPVFRKKVLSGGVELEALINEAGSVRYSIYHPFYRAVSGGSLEVRPGGKVYSTPVFLPDGAVLCAYGSDLAGNRGTTVSVTTRYTADDGIPFSVVSPVPGNWANRQSLLIEASSGTSVRYSLDGDDPLAGGSDYRGPVFLDREGMVTLRLSAIGPDGRSWGRDVLYTVTPKPEPPLPFSVGGDGIVNAGDFAELQLPQGFTCTIGDPPSSGNGQTGILVSAIRGLRRFYPVTVTDGAAQWRWICASGTETGVSETETGGPAVTAGEPAVAIHHWHFVSIDYPEPVYYSLDGSSWKRYVDPVLVNRLSPMSLSWYSPAWKNSEKQVVSLPPKPQIQGIEKGEITANPVYLSVPDSPFDFHYRAGSDFAPQPSIGDPTLDSGLLIEVPNGSAANFRLRFLAVHGGRVHGELDTEFTVDRKAPRTPSLGIPESLTYSRSPVRIVPSGEDMVQLSITPPLFLKDGPSWLLSGDETRPIEYTISSFGVDRAGNKSPVYERKLTVDLNALYVDGAGSGYSDPDGSVQRPFRDLDSALDVIRGNGTWRISLRGTVPLRRSHTIQARVRLTGSSAKVESSGDPVLTLYGGSLDITGCSFTRQAPAAKGLLPLDAVSPAFFEVTNGDLIMRDCSIQASGQASSSLIRAVRSNVNCSGTKLSLSAGDYAILIDSRDSNLYLANSSLEISARNASGVSAASGRLTVRSSTVTVRADTAGRALESWGASVVLQDNLLERTGRSGTAVSGEGNAGITGVTSGNRDTAFWFDKKTDIVSDTGSKVKGFRYPRVRAE